MPRKYKEYEEQKQVIKWWRDMKAIKQYPKHYHLYANRNTHALTVPQRQRATAEGMEAGIPDLFLAVGRGGSHGLYIEMKNPDLKNTKSGGVSDIQNEVITDLEQCGYKCEVHWNALSAIKAIEEYFK